MAATRRSLDYSTGLYKKSKPSAFRSRSSKAPEDFEDVGDRFLLLEDDVQSLIAVSPQGSIDFYNIATTGTAGSPTRVVMNHGLNCEVRYSVLDVNSTSPTSPTYPGFYIHTDTTVNQLVLMVVFAGTFTVRVEPVI